ncbi:MAG: RelA/SpoT family protein [Myxococcota bacterium]
MIRLSDILDKVTAYAPGADLDVVQRAYLVSARCHAGQVRKSGEPYLVHPIAVADILADLHLDVETISVGLLHDVIEDTLITFDELKLDFGQDVAEMVDGLSKIAKMQFRSKEEAQAENFRKMMFAMTKDVRVILVKLADRTHNMRTLQHMSSDKQRRIAQETLDIYAPIANRLGIQRLKIELEDLSFKYLHPEIYQLIQQKLESSGEERQAHMERIKGLLSKSMLQNELECVVSGRVKHPYSIYRKMVRNQVEFEQVYDLTAFRITVDNLGQCYQALGIVHSMYRPISERFKDYVAVPKANGYQSLHTTVIGPKGEHIEVQIRTRNMHAIAETGIAAHWRYKEGKLSISREEIEKVARLRQLYEMAKEVKDPAEFMQSVRNDLFTEEIYVFTPAGEVKEFPEGSTPLDFAFSVHTEVGLRCVGAKINGRIVPFNYQLRSGDAVEILTNPTAHPNSDWVNLVVTSRAKNKIRAYLRQAERDRARQLGLEVLEKEFKKYGLNLNKAVKENEFSKILDRYHLRTMDELYEGLGSGKLPLDKTVAEVIPAEVIEKLNAQLAKKNASPGIVDRLKERLLPTKKASSSSPVTIRGEGDIMVNFARCCNPLHGDPILGLITIGHGITVHSATCPNALNMDESRRIEVAWDEAVKMPRNVRVRVICVNRSGLLASMTKIISQESVNITSAECRVIEDEKAVNNFDVMVSDRATLQRVMLALERIRGVISVERVLT